MVNECKERGSGGEVSRQKTLETCTHTSSSLEDLINWVSESAGRHDYIYFFFHVSVVKQGLENHYKLFSMSSLSFKENNPGTTFRVL